MEGLIRSTESLFQEWEFFTSPGLLIKCRKDACAPRWVSVFVEGLKAMEILFCPMWWGVYLPD